MKGGNLPEAWILNYTGRPTKKTHGDRVPSGRPVDFGSTPGKSVNRRSGFGRDSTSPVPALIRTLWIYLRLCRMRVVDALLVTGLAAVLIATELGRLSSQGASCVLEVANANDVVALSLVLTNPRSIGCEVS
jgi:hypothetical protein